MSNYDDMMTDCDNIEIFKISLKCELMDSQCKLQENCTTHQEIVCRDDKSNRNCKLLIKLT